MIEIKKVSYKINKNHILKDISCTINDNCLTAIIGPNGSGKTSLLKCIMQFVKYTGEIAIDEKLLQKRSDIAKTITYFSQTHTITFPHIVFKMVLMGRRPHAPFYYSQKDNKLTEDVMEELNLTDFCKEPITHLSGGELQKTFFARSLVQDTKYMLLDEPFNNLDPRYQIAIIKKLKEIKNEKTIVVVLHDIGLLRFFDNIIIIKDGEVFSDKYDREILKQVYDVEFKELLNGSDKIYIPII